MARVTVIGRSGTGKSYYAGGLLESTVPKFDAAVHFDVEDEERGLSQADDPLYGTLPVDRERAQRLDWPKLIYRRDTVRVVPRSLTNEEMRKLYATICHSVMALCERDLLDSAFVSCDEAHNILSQADFPTPVERMITGGRKHGVECLHITQRPQFLHTTVISQADLRVYFGVSDSNDIRKIDQMSTFDAEILEEIPTRTAILENKNTGEYKLIVTDPKQMSVIPTELQNSMEIETIDDIRTRPHVSGDDGIVDEAFPV
jgi:hypothetical protein